MRKQKGGRFRGTRCQRGKKQCGGSAIWIPTKDELMQRLVTAGLISNKLINIGNKNKPKKLNARNKLKNQKGGLYHPHKLGKLGYKNRNWGIRERREFVYLKNKKYIPLANTVIICLYRLLLYFKFYSEKLSKNRRPFIFLYPKNHF